MCASVGARALDEKLAHILDKTLPEGLFQDDEAAIVMFTRKSTRLEPIDDETFDELKRHFTTRQIMEIIYTVGLNQMITRMHAAIGTPVDQSTLELVAGVACPVCLPRFGKWRGSDGLMWRGAIGVNAPARSAVPGRRHFGWLAHAAEGGRARPAPRTTGSAGPTGPCAHPEPPVASRSYPS
jgi:hypothetical protein